MKKRILLMHISDISGHKEASSAIEGAIRLQDKNAQILSINIFDYTGQAASKIITKIYTKTIKNAPIIWSFLYDNKKIISKTNKIKEFVYSKGYKKIKGLIDNFMPDVVIATQAFPCGVCAEYKKRKGNSFKLIGVMTDHATHAYWFEEGVDYYVVPSNEIKQRLISLGILEEKIRPFGIPINPKFKKFQDKEKIFEKLKIDKALPILLVMGGGQGLGPIKKIIKSLDRLKENFQVILICGNNKKLEAQLRNRAQTYRKKITIFGFTKNIDEIMQISTLIITKAGGLTTSEALIKQLPMVIVNPIPGQEVYNTNYLVEKGAAIYVKNAKKINKFVAGLLNNKEKIKQMRRNASMIRKPNSSLDIARFALSLC